MPVESSPPRGGLRASAKSANPQARMQELLQRSNAPGRDNEEMKERNNEGSFIVSEIPTKEESEEVIEEDTEEVPHIVREKTSKETPKQATKSPRKQSTKLSLKDAVLEEGRSPEERITKTRLNVDIDEDLHFWLKGHAIQNRRKLNDLIPRILKAYRDEVEGDGK